MAARDNESLEMIEDVLCEAAGHDMRGRERRERIGHVFASLAFDGMEFLAAARICSSPALARIG